MKKPSEPDALAFSCGADPVHPIVPVSRADQRQPVAAHRQTAIERARAVLEQGAALRGHARLEIQIFLPRRERRPVEEGNDLVENSEIVGDFQVLNDHIRQPEQIIGDPGAHAAARRRMPPMLHISFDELTRGGAQQLRPRNVSLRNHQRHHVLKLIAKAVSAARLIKRRARPDATSQRLIEQPTIEHEVHRPIRGFYLHRAKNVIPVLDDRAQDLFKVGAAVKRNQCSRFFRARRLAEEKDDLRAAPRTQLHLRLQSGARVEAGADFAGESGLLVREMPDDRVCRCDQETRSDHQSTRFGARSDRQTPHGQRTRCSKRCARALPRFPRRSR